MRGMELHSELVCVERTGRVKHLRLAGTARARCGVRNVRRAEGVDTLRPVCQACEESVLAEIRQEGARDGRVVPAA